MFHLIGGETVAIYFHRSQAIIQPHVWTLCGPLRTDPVISYFYCLRCYNSLLFVDIKRLCCLYCGNELAFKDINMVRQLLY